jgi:hypothetical protein
VNIPNLFQPVKITTDQFGQNWVALTNEKRLALVSRTIATPQQFKDLMEARIQFHGVEIINNEIICAAVYNGVVATLVHGRVDPGGNIAVTIKSQTMEAVEAGDLLLKTYLA